MNWTAFFGALAGASGLAALFVLMVLPVLRRPALWLGGTFAIASLFLAIFVGLSS